MPGSSEVADCLANGLMRGHEVRESCPVGSAAGSDNCNASCRIGLHSLEPGHGGQRGSVRDGGGETRDVATPLGWAIEWSAILENDAGGRRPRLPLVLRRNAGSQS
jgi:hypothetical protein